MPGPRDRLFGIPHLTPVDAALFRIIFGAVLLSLLYFQSGLQPLGEPAVFREPGTGYGTGQWAVAHWLRAHADAYKAVYAAALASAACLTIGFVTRLAATVLWGSLFLLVSSRLVTDGSHDWGAPLLALIGLPLAPLGHALGVDALLRRHMGREPAPASGPAYGFAVWWIGFVLGVAFFAAAYAKLRTSGLEWITSGAVGYHFLEDAGDAVVPWGIWIAGHPALTVALSAIAIVVEASLILVAFCRHEGLRLAFGLSGLGLQIGIYLFQGVLWWPWMVMYISFLPWRWLSRSLLPARRLDAAPAGTPGRISWTQAAAVVLLCGSQAYASFARIEYEPLVSYYPMYSGTWPSREAFLASRRWSKMLRYHYGGTDVMGRHVDVPDGAVIVSGSDHGRIVDVIQALCNGRPVPDVGPTLAIISRRLSEQAGRPVDLLDIVVDVQEFDFDQMKLVTATRGLHALTLRLSMPTLEFVAPAFDPPCTRGRI